MDSYIIIPSEKIYIINNAVIDNQKLYVIYTNKNIPVVNKSVIPLFNIFFDWDYETIDLQISDFEISENNTTLK